MEVFIQPHPVAIDAGRRWPNLLAREGIAPEGTAVAIDNKVVPAHRMEHHPPAGGREAHRHTSRLRRMMRLIVITDAAFDAREPESIRLLLEEGIDRVHLRKPGAAESELRRLIEALPPALFPRLSLHDRLPLAVEYGLGGVHLNARNPEVPAGFRGAASRSCHATDELAAHPEAAYLFLSPVFDSISKEGYRAGYTPQELREAAAKGVIGPRTIALGGLRPANCCPACATTASAARPFLATSGQGDTSAAGAEAQAAELRDSKPR